MPADNPNVGRNPADDFPDRPQRPIIVWNGQTLRDVNAESLAALKAYNSPPILFQSGLNVVRLRQLDFDVYVEPLNEHSMKHHLDQAATFAEADRNKNGEMIYYPGPPPKEFVLDLLAMPGWPEDVFPTLSRIARCPFFTAAGNPVIEPGYHAESKIWYAPAQGLTVDPVSPVPTDAEVEEAKRWLLDELLYDFPFQSDADKANAIAFFMTPFLREMIHGPVPMGLLEAPAAGTGKGLLGNALTIPATGDYLATIPQRKSDDEWRKAITAKLLEMPTHIQFDNITGTLQSAALEAALTSEVWEDRFLGESRMVRMKIKTVWLITGNNLQLAGDLYRRVVPIRIDAKMQHPEDRDPTKFRHHPFLPWVKANRGKLIWAALTIIQAWVARGRQQGRETMGSYESWAATLGGILNMMGLSGFLTNVKANRDNVGDESAQLESFVAAWKDRFGIAELIIDPLYEMVEQDENLLPFVMDLEKPRGRKIRLAKYISRNRDRTVGGYQIVLLPKDARTKCLRYCLREVKGNGTATVPKDASPGNKKEEGDEADEPHLADRVIFLPVYIEAVFAVCRDWWYFWGSEIIKEDDLIEPLNAAGAIMARSPEEQRWRCRELLPQLVGCRLDIYQVEMVGYFLDHDGDRHNCYRLKIAEGEKRPPTVAEHTFTAEDLDRLVADLPRCNIPKSEGQ